MSLKNKPERLDLGIVKEFEDINIQRITRGIDTKPKSIRRLTLAIGRHPLWKKMKEDIIKAELKSK